MTATAVIETTSVPADRESHRNACAFLKGYIVGYSKRHGMKWDGDESRTEAFADGFGRSRNVGPKTLTFAHVVYNRLRHDRPHLGSAQRDEEFVEEFRREFSIIANPLLTTLAEYGVEVKEVLG
jgi:hypothetical protein